MDGAGKSATGDFLIGESFEEVELEHILVLIRSNRESIGLCGWIESGTPGYSKCS